MEDEMKGDAMIRRGRTHQQIEQADRALTRAGYDLMLAVDRYLAAQPENEPGQRMLHQLNAGGWGLSGNIVAEDEDEMQLTLVFRFTPPLKSTLTWMTLPEGL